ncbi:MAG: transglutaminase-like putative cysteine protease, partial [Myxococcota bacterium]
MRVRRAGVHGAVIAGLVALAVSGDSVQPIALGALLLSLVADPLRARLAWLPWSAMLAAALAGAVLFALRGAAPVDVVGLALLALVLHRRLGGVSAADDRVAVLVSGLMLVVAGSRYETPILLAAVALWAVSTPLALLPAALDGLVSRPSASFRRLIAALALSVVAVSASLYPVLPRRSDEQVDPASSRTGFATEVTLGEFDALLDDTSEVVRYTLDPQVDGPLYLRGLALDAFDGTRWSASGGVTATQWQWPEVTPAGAHVLSVQVTDASEGVLFAAGQVRAVDATAAVRVGLDRHGSLRADGRPGPLSYRVLVSAPLGPADVAPRPPGEAPSFRYLDLPDTLEPRIHDLAREVVGAGAPIERARRVEAFLRSDYTYALTGLASDGAAPLDRFLFEDKAGHCQYFASAAAVLLRSEGVPARVVTGFVGGDLDARTGEWVVQNRHAHTWIEVFDGWGWVLIDPTPGPAATTAFPVSEWSVSEAAYGVWSSAVTDYDGAAQLAA